VNAEFKVKVNIINGKFEILSAFTEISFGSLALNSTAAFQNGDPLSWEEFNAGIKELFDGLWPILKPKVDEKVKATAQEAFKVSAKSKYNFPLQVYYVTSFRSIATSIL
jgi:hypothetical protein